MTNTLLKAAFHRSLTQTVYDEITTGTAKYYYFLGKSLPWDGAGDTPAAPLDSAAYEADVRNNLITAKAINVSDASMVCARRNWAMGQVYDIYDDSYGTSVLGIDLTSGGTQYNVAPQVYIGSTGSVPFTPGAAYQAGDLVRTSAGIYYGCISGNIAGPAPDAQHYVPLNVYDAGGAGATASATLIASSIASINLLTSGAGYTGNPSVVLVGGGGSGAIATAVVGIAASGAQSLSDSNYYVVTDEFNVYKCLDNNQNQPSTFKPIGTDIDPMVAPDGYVWRYLFNIPIALRLKFLTDDYFPVADALTAQFYSNGALQTINIDARGSGYTSGSITVSGDGYLESDPQYLDQVIVLAGGTNYAAGTTSVTVESPVPGTIAWQPNIATFAGQKLAFNYNVYNVVSVGVTSSEGPTHTHGIAPNGTSSFEYVGSIPPLTLTIQGGAVTDVTALAMLRQIDVVQTGSGYLSAPVVNIAGNAAARATVVLGSVTRIDITDNGSGYTSAPTVTLGTAWTANAALQVNDQVASGGKLYTCTAAGTTGSTAPTHSTGSAANGTTTLAYAGVAASASAQIKYGAGYSKLPAVTIVDTTTGSGAQVAFRGAKSEARLIPVFSGDYMGVQFQPSTAYQKGALVWADQHIYQALNSGTSGLVAPSHIQGTYLSGDIQFQYYSTFGQLDSVQIVDPGVGYTSAILTVNGDGEGASISANLSVGNVNTLQANNELLTIAGGVMNVQVVSHGWGYDGATLSVRGDGSGAEFQAVTLNGKIDHIVVVSHGQGYHWCEVEVSGNGFGAVLRPIISPYGGHGKFALNELGTHTLMLYSNVSSEKNQGFDVNNDFRQVGILKNPTQFNGTNKLAAPLVSACWAVGASSNPALFPVDSVIRDASNGFRYQIVTNSSVGLLLQSLDQGILTPGSLMVNDANQNFVITSVTAPTMDKFSGDLLYIDNNQPFVPTANQAVILRTIITF